VVPGGSGGVGATGLGPGRAASGAWLATRHGALARGGRVSRDRAGGPAAHGSACCGSRTQRRGSGAQCPAGGSASCGVVRVVRRGSASCGVVPHRAAWTRPRGFSASVWGYAACAEQQERDCGSARGAIGQADESVTAPSGVGQPSARRRHGAGTLLIVRIRTVARRRARWRRARVASEATPPVEPSPGRVGVDAGGWRLPSVLSEIGEHVDDSVSRLARRAQCASVPALGP
jgi:hypothetical protein